MDRVRFDGAAAWRAWLAANHATATELWVELDRVGGDGRGLRYAAALDEALCFGWIDGQRRSIDEARWTIRFTPRKKGSIWSQLNLRHYARLDGEGRVAPPGRAAFAARDPEATKKYSFEQDKVVLDEEYEGLLRRNKKAWAFWTAQPPSYRKPATWWVISARQEATRRRRLAMLVEDCAAGRRIKPLRWTKGRPDPRAGARR